jgi:glycolate oxidase
MVLKELAAVLGGDVVVDSDLLESHRHDMARFCDAGVPVALVRPRSTAEVADVLRVATAHRTPVVTQGARTGLAGAANAVDGCVLLSTARMNRILRVDAVEQVAVVQPGVTNADLSRAVLEEGLFYPPDPSSWESSTIGGNVATNAGGLCCVKYGVTGDYVRGLEVVLASGEVLRVGRSTAKGVAGYDLTHLLVGSEGTLGVVTEVTLALRPGPEAALTVAATFTSGGDALRAASAVMASGLRPSLLEFLDRTTTRAIRDYRDLGLPADAEGLLLVQSDRGARASDDVARIAELCEREGATEVARASDAAEASMLLEARRLVNASLERLGVTLVDDVAVPRARLAELLAGVERIAAEHDVLLACPGHVGDGNMHPTVIFDPDDPAARGRAMDAFGAVMELGLALGGTITGEHGVGRLKRGWLAGEVGQTGIRLQRGIKRLFDPAGILNPGAVLEEDP